MKNVIGYLSIEKAVDRIKARPAYYAARDVARARQTNTPGRYRQKALAAGRQALAEALFELMPELEGRFDRLKKAIRNGCGSDVNFDWINEQGAKALNLL